MSVQPGQSLGKYQLIEKVGQGGMAVVYRGQDTSLKREVAIKVLHNHLAEHREARERFGREAEAVAKLRHENILEIHDFSGLDSEETYIVTEFIDGCTLKEFITEHHLRFPEIGAMISSQVCGALAHAHGLGVLHRDVKPENIMIRSDGVVKLTDFGIAQMIDLQRMTVTGQLLGSPAYMAPEHVEGGNLDFRTDVFAVGIVLYQLVTGELPFHGKNPHEILKRIADCQYADPARLNPRVGRQLGGIIRKALQKAPDDRYGDISLMQQALDEYLEGSGVQSSKEELERFFESPAPYQMALEKRLVDYLSERGKGLLASNRVAALELFNRVLSIDEANEEVLEHLSRLGARQRNLRIAAVLIGLALLAVLATVAKKRFAAKAADSAALAQDAGLGDAGLQDASSSLTSDAANAFAVGILDAGIADAARPPDARANGASQTTIRRRRADAAPLRVTPKTRLFTLEFGREGAEYKIGAAPWEAATAGTIEASIPAGEQVVRVRKQSCCQEISKRIGADSEGGTLSMNLQDLPGEVVPICAEAGVRVRINGRVWTLGKAAPVPITRVVGTEIVRVEFSSADRVDSRQVTIAAKQRLEHVCSF